MPFGQLLYWSSRTIRPSNATLTRPRVLMVSTINSLNDDPVRFPRLVSSYRTVSRSASIQEGNRQSDHLFEIASNRERKGARGEKTVEIVEKKDRKCLFGLSVGARSTYPASPQQHNHDGGYHALKNFVGSEIDLTLPDMIQ